MLDDSKFNAQPQDIFERVEVKVNNRGVKFEKEGFKLLTIDNIGALKFKIE